MESPNAKWAHLETWELPEALEYWANRLASRLDAGHRREAKEAQASLKTEVLVRRQFIANLPPRDRNNLLAVYGDRWLGAKPETIKHLIDDLRPQRYSFVITS